MVPVMEKNARPNVVQCRACGTAPTHPTFPGKGPHFKEIHCCQCFRHIKWVPWRDTGVHPSVTKEFIVNHLMRINDTRPATAQALGALVLKIWPEFRGA